MRLPCLLILLLLHAHIFAQRVHWCSIETGIDRLSPNLPRTELTSARRRAVVAYLAHRYPLSGTCLLPQSAFASPQFRRAPLGRPGIVYVAANCYGSPNEPIWLVDFVHGRPRALAEMGGWGLGIQPHVSHGLHDFVIGSHRSAFETPLDWFRFDGTRYRLISSATAYSEDEVGTARMQAERAACDTARRPCNLIRYRQPDSNQ